MRVSTRFAVVLVLLISVGCDDGGDGATDVASTADGGTTATDTESTDATDPDQADMTAQGPRITAIAAGEQHSVLLAEDGTVYVTGSNADGQFCLPEETGFFESFTAVEGLTGIAGIEAGSATSFFLDGSGGAVACGFNGGGRLGIDDASVTRQFAPAAVQAPGIVEVKSGGGHSFTIDGAGLLYGFGSNVNGEVGIGTTGSNTDTPTGLSTLEDETVVAFDAAAGGGFSVAVIDGGAVYTWGNNLQGQLGDAGDGPNAVNPQVLDVNATLVDIAAGGTHTIALADDGSVWAWGVNTQGELGLGTQSAVERPTQIAGLANVTAIDAGYTFSLALDADGAVWVWGECGQGQCGQGPQGGPNATAPVQVPGLPPIEAIVAGGRFALALTTEGRVWGWGLVDAAQLGTGVGEWQFDPIEIF